MSKCLKSVENINVSFLVSNNIDFWFRKIDITENHVRNLKNQISERIPEMTTFKNFEKLQNERDHKFDLLRVKSYRLLVAKIDMRQKCGN